MIDRSMPVLAGDARDLERAAEAGEEGAEEQRAGEQHRLVDAERRHHVAILRRGRTRMPKRVLRSRSQTSPSTTGPAAISTSS